MSFSDEIARLLGSLDDDREVTSAFEPVDPEMPQGLSATERARWQFRSANTNFSEGPEGTFHASGARFGCGYAEAVIVVDDESQTASVRVGSGIRLTPELMRPARKICRRLNQDFIVAGLAVADDGELVFVPEPVDMSEGGGDVEDVCGKGFSTLHSHVWVAMDLLAGRDPLDVLHGEKEPGSTADEPDWM